MLRKQPYSCLRPRSLRVGVTLTEVLISIGILAVGLLGAAAMFPVGGYFMQKGEVADRGAAIAQAAFADLVARGALDPQNWRVWHGGAYATMDQFMQTGMADNRDQFGILDQIGMNSDTGFIYIIDPLGTAGALRGGAGALQLSRAPAVIPVNWAASTGNRWDQFNGAWPIRRLCTDSMMLGSSLPSESLAQSLYSSSDDLAIQTDDDESLPRRQRMVGADTNGDQTVDVAYRRESRGDYSWMAMVAPTQSEARLALALDPSAYYFDVSVVVFYKRPISSIGTSEVLVEGSIVSTGTGGGEILLDASDLPGDGSETAYDEFRQGQWVMVCGPHPSSTPAQPLFFSQWYRVLAIDDELRGPITNTDTQRLVGLRGPDWPWKKSGSRVCVGLFPGAVAVHSKTMRLESSGAYEL